MVLSVFSSLILLTSWLLIQTALIFLFEGKIPNAQARHIQVFCEDDDVNSDKYKDLKELLRQGFGVRCQLRAPEFILKGPVMFPVKDAREYERILRCDQALHLGIKSEASVEEVSTSCETATLQIMHTN